MDTQAQKRKEKVEDDDGDGSDRISELPEPVLLHILCFLSHKKALQTCVLSKSWRHLGSNRPVIDLCRTCETCFKEIRFCENCFAGNKEAFVSVLDSTFQRYHNRNIFTQELRLLMLNIPDSQSTLEKWIPIFIKSNIHVNKFRLSFETSWTYIFDLPSVVFQAESLRELYLHGCRLNKVSLIDSVVLKNLQKLTLVGVDIASEAMEKIMSGCPLVEYVGLFWCKGLKTIEIANKNHYLKHFEFSCCYGENHNEYSIGTDVTTLQSIRIVGSNWYHNDNNYFPRLKSLYLSGVKLSTESFYNFSCNFPCLEELMLIYCCGLEEIKLSSRSIKRLSIRFMSSIMKVAIDAPNILHFEFYSRVLPTTFSIGATSMECKSYLALLDCVSSNNDVLSWLLRLIEMVKTLSQSQISLTLHENLCFEITQIEWSFDDHPIVMEHLALNIGNSCPDSLPHLLNVLFRIFRPRYITAVRIFPNDDEKVNEFLWKILIHEREKREYGWDQHLVEVSIEASDKKGEVWHHTQWTCLPKWSKNQKIRFRLKWRD